MYQFRFKAPTGDTIDDVNVSYDEWGNHGWSININHFYCGTLQKTDGGWEQSITNRHEFTLDDIQALGERIDEYSKNKKLYQSRR